MDSQFSIGMSHRDIQLAQLYNKATAAFLHASDIVDSNTRLLSPYYEDSSTGYISGASELFSASKKMLMDDLCDASFMLLAAKMLLGSDIINWEPDTIWSELGKKYHIDLSLVNRNKLLAAITLTTTPDFLMDAECYSNILYSFNNEIPEPERYPIVSPSYLAWGLFEASILLSKFSIYGLTMDREPVLYTAACLHEAGLVMSPPGLEFSQTLLTNLNKNSSAPSLESVNRAWAASNKGQDLTLETDPSDEQLQVSRLQRIRVYLVKRASNYIIRSVAFTALRRD